MGKNFKSNGEQTLPEVVRSEEATPNPEFLIKSIAEQGYSLETALADLMDNSISAKASKIEVLVNQDVEPFKLFLADNGSGMSEEELTRNMQFPSASMENQRDQNDLGRFGLGLKTASFSQTRCFTVLSRRKGEMKFSGRTWDINFLKKNGWKIIVNSEEEIAALFEEYTELSKDFLQGFSDFEPNTIIVWNGLYKFEQFLEQSNRKIALSRELNEVTSEHLSLVFHRFMERSTFPLKIRINNLNLKPFNPFPEGLRKIEPRERVYKDDVIQIEGFVLPAVSINESKSGISKWTTRYRSLFDMEGLYVYREDRIILFGGWNGLIKKSSRMQLARMKVEVGNGVDNLLHLNVAKSQIAIPFELRKAFENYIADLKLEAEREFYSTPTTTFASNPAVNLDLFLKKASNKGTLLEINKSFPLISSLRKSMTKDQNSKLNLLIRMLNTRINKVRRTHQEESFVGVEEKDGISTADLINCILSLKNDGFNSDTIKDILLPSLGYNTESLPQELTKLL